MDNNNQPFTPITTVHIAEVLAEIPWTIQRARQHIVNEVAQALHKVLIFNNQHNTPFQKWAQGHWHSQWSTSAEWEYICTLYTCIAVPENKVKIRKGRELGWEIIPVPINEILTSPNNEEIHDVEDNGPHSQEMEGAGKETVTATLAHVYATPVKKPFSVLGDEKEYSS